MHTQREEGSSNQTQLFSFIFNLQIRDWLFYLSIYMRMQYIEIFSRSTSIVITAQLYCIIISWINVSDTVAYLYYLTLKRYRNTFPLWLIPSLTSFGRFSPTLFDVHSDVLQFLGSAHCLNPQDESCSEHLHYVQMVYVQDHALNSSFALNLRYNWVLQFVRQQATSRVCVSLVLKWSPSGAKIPVFLCISLRNALNG